MSTAIIAKHWCVFPKVSEMLLEKCTNSRRHDLKTPGEVYELMTEKEVVVVGGGALTVGAAGGYLQGGGHSANSPKLGLAVDNLLEADIVIADGTLLTINKCWHTDLFWAIRGGGGGTFGIVTRAVYKAHEKESNYFKF